MSPRKHFSYLFYSSTYWSDLIKRGHIAILIINQRYPVPQTDMPLACIPFKISMLPRKISLEYVRPSLVSSSRSLGGEKSAGGALRGFPGLRPSPRLTSFRSPSDSLRPTGPPTTTIALFRFSTITNLDLRSIRAPCLVV